MALTGGSEHDQIRRICAVLAAVVHEHGPLSYSTKAYEAAVTAYNSHGLHFEVEAMVPSWDKCRIHVRAFGNTFHGQRHDSEWFDEMSDVKMWLFTDADAAQFTADDEDFLRSFRIKP